MNDAILAIEAAARAWKRDGDADSLFRHALELAPESTQIRLAYAYYRWAIGATDAEAHALAATRLDDPIEAWRMLAELRRDRGDSAGAAEALRRAHRLSDDADDALALGTLYAESGFADAAEAWFLRVCEDAPDRHEGWLHLALHRRLKGDTERAKSLLGTAADLAPRRAEVWTEVSALCLDQGDYEAADEAADRAVKYDRKNVWAFVNRALARWALGAMPAAERDLRSAIRLAPESPEFHAWLGALLAESGKERQADEAFERADALGMDVAPLRVKLSSF